MYVALDQTVESSSRATEELFHRQVNQTACKIGGVPF